MGKAEFRCVQRQAWSAAFIGARRLLQIAMVDAFATHRMAELREMNADLMRASRFQSARDERISRQRFLDGDVRDGILADVGQRGALLK